MPTKHNLKTTENIESLKFRINRNPHQFRRFSVSDTFDQYIGGLPYGLTIFYGEPGTGKSYMANHIANITARKKKIVLYVFSESIIDTEKLDTENIITLDYTYYLPSWQKVLEQIYAFLNATSADILILDSITKLFSETKKAVEEAELRDALSDLKRNLRNSIPIIGISQIRGQGMFTYPAGGRAIDHESDLLIEFEKMPFKENKGRVTKTQTSYIYTINVEKDKQGLAYTKSKLAVNYKMDEYSNEILEFTPIQD